MLKIVTLLVVGVLVAGCAKTTAPVAENTDEPTKSREENKTQAVMTTEEKRARQVVDGFLSLVKEGTAEGGSPLKVSAAVGTALTKGAIRSVNGTSALVENVKGLAQIPDDPEWSYQIEEIQVSEDGTNASVNVVYTSSEGSKTVSFMVGEEDGSWKIDSTN